MSLPSVGSRVRVSGHRATTDAQVAQSEAGRLILRIPAGARGASGLGEAVAVEWITQRGLRGATGSVAFGPADAVPALGVLLTLSLPTGRARAAARVVRAGAGTVAFQFVGLADADRDRVVVAVFERLRRLPRVRGAEG